MQKISEKVSMLINIFILIHLAYIHGALFGGEGGMYIH
jgi:hypothetical protein